MQGTKWRNFFIEQLEYVCAEALFGEERVLQKNGEKKGFLNENQILQSHHYTSDSS